MVVCICNNFYDTVGGLWMLEISIVVPHYVNLREESVTMSTNDEIAERVKKIVIEQLGVKPDEVASNEASFVDDLGADSLDTVELVMALEEEFETEIPDEEAEKITTIQQAIDYIKANSKEKENS